MVWEGLNRRRFPRVTFPCLVKVAHPGAETETLLTHTENVSVGGICVIIKRRFELFTPVTLELDLMDSEDLILSPGKVVWLVRRKATEEHKPSCYDTGIEFVDLKAQDRERLSTVIDRLAAARQGQRHA